jgi:hypothetical protein
MSDIGLEVLVLYDNVASLVTCTCAGGIVELRNEGNR